MQNCRECGFKGWRKTDKKQDNIRMWKCGRCGNLAQGDAPFVRTPIRELYLDIETSLITIKGGIFSLKMYDKYLPANLVERPFYIICWAALWTDKPNRVFSGCVTQEEAIVHDDSRILTPLRDLMDSADSVAGHNVAGFDIKKINTRLSLNGIAEPEPYKIADTLKIARSKYSFERNTLDYLCWLYGVPQKDHMVRDDWDKIEATGDEKTLRKMNKYCRNDVKNGAKILELLRSNVAPDYALTRFKSEPKYKKSPRY